MIEKENGQWELCQYKVIHKSHGNKQIHYTNDRDYWRKTVDKHDHLTDLRFEEIDFSSAQKQRLEKLNQLDTPEPFHKTARDMVREGITEDDPVTEHRVRGNKQAVKRGRKRLDDVKERYRDKVEKQLGPPPWAKNDK